MKAPTKLSRKARHVWNEISTGYELRVDEYRILEDACREIDLIERLEEELSDGELTVRGSQGQPVASPLVQELRQHRAVLARLLGVLKLPDSRTSEEGDRSASAREAVMARWGRVS